eukprot:gb/GECG01001153.1/.p1 GENE.gb/GECG01001153.1/~~gb/GECG01001153.1/.p1  ORF type:complete len:623 (+),score=68.55 gb/GECG01001153.1/:1-1869(+)
MSSETSELQASSSSETTTSYRDKRLEKTTHTRREDVMFYRDFFGLLRVQGYFFTYHCNVKKRWIGRNLFDIFTTDFGRHSEKYVDKALSKGAFCVEFKGKRSRGTHQTQCRDSQVVYHRILRFEPPVLPEWPKVIAETDELMVIVKPPSMPLHPCGGYNELSISPMLKKGIYEDWRHLEAKEQTNSPFQKWSFVRFLPFDAKGNNDLAPVQPPSMPALSGLYILHRLDRLTSGLVLLGKNKEATAKYSELIRSGDVRKIYVARTSKHFPVGSFEKAPDNGDSPYESVPTIHPFLQEQVKYTWVHPNETEDSERIQTVGRELCMDEEETKTLGSKLRKIEDRYSDLFNKVNEGKQMGAFRESQWLCVYGALCNVEPQRGIQGIAIKGQEDDYTDTHRKTRNTQSLPGGPKNSLTVFRIISFDPEGGDEGHSVVFCMPVTGRTHQIRVHLQAIGYPISNDPYYWKPLSSVDSASTDPSKDAARAAVQDLTYEREATSDSSILHNEKSVSGSSDEHSWKYKNPYYVPLSKENLDSIQGQKLPQMSEDTPDVETETFAPDKVLGDLALELRNGCTLRGDVNDFNVMQLQCMGLWLHACCYEHVPVAKDSDLLWSFTSPLPYWVKSL